MKVIYPEDRSDNIIPGAPDMSLVTDETVASALPRVLTESRIHKRWGEMSGAVRAAHTTILRKYISAGQPPKLEDLDSELLQNLAERDLIVLRAERIHAAYPFSTVPTRHSVTIDGVETAAVCAIDALGTAAMVHRPVAVSSTCPQCEAKLEVSIAADGLTVEACHPDTARVWAGIVPIKGTAADTQCQSMLMFCSEAHLEDWRKARPNSEGFSLSVQQGTQLGAAMFAPFLASSD